MIPPDIEAQILRFYHAEKWTIGTIARQLHIHNGVVRRVLAQAGLPKSGRPPRKSLIDPYLPFIRQTLETFPALTASRLYGMVRERGYQGRPITSAIWSPVTGRAARRKPICVCAACPANRAKWTGLTSVVSRLAARAAALMAFVMVLSHSRQIFLRFFPDARMESFLHGHVAAFNAWGGALRVLLYDNLKSVVLERRGDAMRFHPEFLRFAGDYRYEPRPVAVARGNEKGRVERAIRFVRESFFAARTFADIDDLNAQAEAWCIGAAADRRCPEEPERTVRAVFDDERPRLLALPHNPEPVLERVAVSVGKTPDRPLRPERLLRHPFGHVRRVLTVLADPHEVRIADGAEVLARHPRSYDRRAQIEVAAHIQSLVDDKHAARQHRATDRLAQAAPASQTLLMRAAERGANLGAITVGLLRLLERYGAAALQDAILEALVRDAPHPNAVRLVLERWREQRGDAPPIAPRAASACSGARCASATARPGNL